MITIWELMWTKTLHSIPPFQLSFSIYNTPGYTFSYALLMYFCYLPLNVKAYWENTDQILIIPFFVVQTFHYISHYNLAPCNLFWLYYAWMRYSRVYSNWNKKCYIVEIRANWTLRLWNKGGRKDQQKCIVSQGQLNGNFLLKYHDTLTRNSTVFKLNYHPQT